MAEYRLTRAECVKYLLMLDRMGLVELLPGDRIRPRVARDFDWSPDGPIRRYFMEHARSMTSSTATSARPRRRWSLRKRL